MILHHIDTFDATVAALDTRIATEIAPYQAQLELIKTIDGFDTRNAQVLIAETGADMTRFPTASHLASSSPPGTCSPPTPPTATSASTTSNATTPNAASAR